MIAIAARSLTAGYNGLPAVHGIDLEVASGEMVLLAGPNGAGKTTTLMAMSGAIEPLAGHVEVDGRPTRQKLHERTQDGLGVITEARTVFNHLTTLENLRLGRGTVEDALASFPELTSRLRVRAGLLSGGEQQMLSLARVLAARPKVVVVDELSFGLAPLIVSRLLRSLRDAANAGTSVLLVEQHVQTCLKIVDRAYFMRLGKIVKTGPAQGFAQQSTAEIAELYL